MTGEEGEKEVSDAIGAVNRVQILTVLVVIRDEEVVVAVGIATKEIVTGPMSSKFMTFVSLYFIRLLIF